jgi:hypothetical protein
VTPTVASPSIAHPAITRRTPIPWIVGNRMTASTWLAIRTFLGTVPALPPHRHIRKSEHAHNRECNARMLGKFD